MKREIVTRRRLAGEMRKVRVHLPRPVLPSLSEAWPKAKLRKRRQPCDLTDHEVDLILALPDPPDCYDDDYDGAY